MLEKYRKMAHDAHLNGDRVTEEYYLQFADHYFRVIADQRQRQDEPRQPRRDDRGEYGDEFMSDDETFGESMPYRPPHDSRPANDRPANERPAYERPSHERAPSQERAPAPERTARPEPEARADVQEAAPVAAPAESEEPRSMYEPTENPFVRDNKGASRGLKQRKPRRPRGDEGSDEPSGNVAEEAPAGFDASVLPPSISARSEDAVEAEAEAEAKPRARRRTRRLPAGEGDGNVEAVG